MNNTKESITYQDCADALLNNVITDGEYNRIMDKLNAKYKINALRGEADGKTGN